MEYRIGEGLEGLRSWGSLWTAEPRGGGIKDPPPHFTGIQMEMTPHPFSLHCLHSRGAKWSDWSVFQSNPLVWTTLRQIASRLDTSNRCNDMELLESRVQQRVRVVRKHLDVESSSEVKLGPLSYSAAQSMNVE